MLIPEVSAKNRVMIYVYGGSFVGGTRSSWRSFCASLAHASSSETYVPDLHRSPEHPFPAALEDVNEVLKILLSVNKDVVLVGDSAAASLIVGSVFSLPTQMRSKIKEVVLMGGSTIKGNASPVAEANIIQDPEAAYILFKSGLKIKMAGLDATWDGYIAFDELEEFGKANWLSEKIYSMCGIYAEHYRERMKNPGLAMHDSLTLAWLIKPELVKAEDYYVTVDINGRYTYGMTVTDVDNVMKYKPNATVAMGVDRVPFINMIKEAIANLAAQKK